MADRRMTNDSLTNLMSGLGTDKDKTGYSQYGWLPLDDNQLTNAYRGDWIARKVVDIPAYDATRKWRAWQAEADQIEELERAERRFGLRRKVRLAMTYGRLYGGGAIIMGFGDNNPMEPIDRDAPTLRDGLKYLHTVSRLTLRAGDLEPDINSENFGLPQFYEVSTNTGMSVRIHHTRVVRFTGNEIPDGAPNLNTGWSDSVLQSVDDAIKQAGNSSGNIAALVQEAKIDVIKIPGLMEQIDDPNYRSEVMEKYRLANIGKSTLNMLLLDDKETWERITVNFTGLPDILKLYLLLAAAAAHIPATLMLGQSPLGMNATGDGDLRNHYDRIQSEQEDQVTPAMTILDEALIWSTLGQRDPDIYYDWNSLWQMDDAQRADVNLKKAQAHQVDVGAALIPEEALRIGRQNQLIEDGVYPGLEAALKDLGADKIDKTAEEDVDETNPEVVAEFERQQGLRAPDPTKNASNVVALKRVDAFDADGDDADFNFVGSDGSFSGYAVRWGHEYHDGFRVQHGAFEKVIEATGGKVRLLYQHDIKLPIGMAVLSEDDVGLRVDGQLNMDLALARETKTNIEKNILNGLSIGYETFVVAKNDPKLLVEIPVDEVSVVMFPSMEEATIDGGPGSGPQGGGGSKESGGAKLTATEQSFVDNYSGDAFLQLNVGNAAKNLDSAIGKFEVAEGTTLYRGVSKEAMKSLIGGDTITAGAVLSDKAYLSTSSDPFIATVPGGVMLQIEVGGGQKGLDMSKHSRNPHEKETLLPRGTSMTVLGIKAPKSAGQPVIVRVSVGKHTKDSIDCLSVGLVADATPRTLYVCRDVINGADILKWAKEQGIVDTLPQSELHVTLIYMETPIDWMKLGEPGEGELIVPPGGPRCVEVLGSPPVVVLEFLSSMLCYRHEDMIARGATHSYPEYRPHITIGPLPEGMDAMKLEPYRGKIVLGPELFEEVK